MPSCRQPTKPFRHLRQAIRRVLTALLAACAFGFGGGLAGLGSGTQQVGKPERDNPIVCVAERSSERNE